MQHNLGSRSLGSICSLAGVPSAHAITGLLDKLRKMCRGGGGGEGIQCGIATSVTSFINHVMNHETSRVYNGCFHKVVLASNLNKKSSTIVPRESSPV